MKDKVLEPENQEPDYSVLEKVILTRKSIRGFERAIVTEEDREKLQQFINSINVPFEHNVDITLNSNYKNPGISSVFIINVTSDFAAISAPDSLSDKTKAGFLGELFVLYCESLGIATCWVGNFKKAEAYSQIFGQDEENVTKKIFCLIAMGYNLSGKGFMNKITKKIYSSNRKSLDESLSADSIKKIPDKIMNAFELSRVAPSARNRQCWYFKVTGDQKTSAGKKARAASKKKRYIVEIGKPENYKSIGWPHPDLDVGIAASHFWLGIKNQKIESTIEIKELKDRVIWQFAIAV